MKKDEVKKGQLVKLIDEAHRWSDFVNTDRVGVVLEYDNHQAKVLFVDGETEKHWYFALEAVNEKS